MLDTEEAWNRCKTVRFLPAFLIRQKSEIFASFPPGEAIAPAALNTLNDNLPE